MKRFLIALLFCLSLGARERNLLLFLDKDREERVDNEFNVSYQLVVALLQKPGDMIVAEHLLQNIVRRKNDFERKMNKQGTLEAAFYKMFQKVEFIAAQKPVDFINKKLDTSWLGEHFPQVAQASIDRYKQVAFNFFCRYVLQHSDDWRCIKKEKGLLLCTLRGKSDFLLRDIKISRFEQQGSVIKVLSSFVKNKRDEWVIYLSGHGYPCDETKKCAMVAGMAVPEFQDFLHFADKKMNVTLLAYNSCFAGGRDGLSAYEKDGKQLAFSYPIIMISISDAPTYVFGTPSGFKLPPYSNYNQLDISDVKNHLLQPFFLQYFPDFFTYAHQKFCGPECMFLINRYKECLEDECEIFKIENMPLVRYPGAQRFTPLNEASYFVMDEVIDDPVIVENQKVILWYQHRYDGTVYCIGSTPVFVSMLHQEKNIHTIQQIIISTDINSFLRKAFVFLEDQSTETVWNIQQCIVQTRRGEKIYNNVVVKQNKRGVIWNY